MHSAIQISEESGFKGRLAFHSLPQSRPFYERIGMIDLGIDVHRQHLRRYEFTALTAATFLSEKA
jgi:hypothetical protein